ncbi:MAG: hypothetical protein KDK65_03970 [Chlamydiia bacterium]|nr:hypothetical protein [Chlamydiia bacterium]
MGQTKKTILAEMNALLDELIATAKELSALSEQVIAEEELAALQQRQDRLIRDLEKLEADYKIRILSEEKPKATALQKQIRDKMTQFQELNRDFMKNITQIHGLIHFEKRE